jgi:hypothetical protein
VVVVVVVDGGLVVVVVLLDGGLVVVVVVLDGGTVVVVVERGTVVVVEPGDPDWTRNLTASSFQCHTSPHPGLKTPIVTTYSLPAASAGTVQSNRYWRRCPARKDC